jgi:hypothetical protein
MGTFPVILIPEPLKKVRRDPPPEPPAPKLRPAVEPKLELLDRLAISVGHAFEAVGNWIKSFRAKQPILAFFVSIPILLLVIILYPLKLNNQERKRLYEQKLKNYQSILKSNSKLQKQYEESVQFYRTREGKVKYRTEKLKQLLSGTKSPDAENQISKQGALEQAFYEKLNSYFPEKIQLEKGLLKPNGFVYTPDFIYFDPQSNLHIDIEVDEPYTPKTGHPKKPIHYLESESDHKRNQFFLDKTWLVIRFAEEQVKRYPDSCCKVIAQTIAKLLDDDSILAPFQDVAELEPVRRWTRQEAEEMADIRYRSSYSRSSGDS